MAVKLVKHLMVANVVCISPFSTLREALSLMKKHTIKCLVVDRQTPHDAYGLITYTNILKTIIAEEGDIDLINVYDVCIKPALAVSQEMAVKYAADLMIQHHLKRLLVTSDNQLVGLLTVDDMVKDILLLID
ncbi:histidine kinase [Arsukibacterium sp. MJ3]|jgi:predicted transcriptional regulator|uniref:CBS domain-containing protein n=1 Tax=Arsukibacterium sp. MJ3 TaxID=1632859 RepID=UPI0006273568|nr:CBS domain-containing protein [Arsukibacterium sp. MJ3]KKO49863.1 histidine kinase [Arsukibacterium sp. MJ3]